MFPFFLCLFFRKKIKMVIYFTIDPMYQPLINFTMHPMDESYLTSPSSLVTLPSPNPASPMQLQGQLGRGLHMSHICIVCKPRWEGGCTGSMLTPPSHSLYPSLYVRGEWLLLSHQFLLTQLKCSLQTKLNPIPHGNIPTGQMGGLAPPLCCPNYKAHFYFQPPVKIDPTFQTPYIYYFFPPFFQKYFLKCWWSKGKQYSHHQG